jgi:hypothetical protein
LGNPHPGGRPRKHASAAERVREHRKRKRRNETSSVTPDGPAFNETSAGSRVPSLKGLLVNAAEWNVDLRIASSENVTRRMAVGRWLMDQC